MKTKDFIKMLQDADPTGEMHVRMPDGIPIFAEPKPGYWDGSYNYIDDDGNWVTSMRNDKVDIHVTTMEDYISDILGDTYNDKSWDEIRDKFKFELTYSLDQHNKEKIDRILDRVRKCYDEQVEYNKSYIEKSEERAIQSSNNGWTWFQNKLVDDKSIRPNNHMYYTWLIYDVNGKTQSSNLYNTESVVKSGLFEKIDNGVKEGYYQWIKK